MKASEFLKRYEARQQREEDDTDTRDHSLQAQARERAAHPQTMQVGTAFDWEDMDAYQDELERLEREGPGKS